MVDGVWLLVSGGMAEKAVLDLPLDKFFLYQEAARRNRSRERQSYVLDTAAAIGGIFSKDGVAKYLKTLDGE